MATERGVLKLTPELLAANADKIRRGTREMIERLRAEGYVPDPADGSGEGWIKVNGEEPKR